MITVKSVFEFLNGLFPSDTALDFDNVGLLIGDGNAEVTSAVVALDCTDSVIDFALKNSANLIVTHHPVIFDGLKQILKGDIAYRLIENGISVISMHTNMDVGLGGVNDTLCSVLCLNNIQKVTAADGYTLNIGELKNTLSADAFATLVSERLGVPVKYAGTNKIKKVLVCSGSGGGYVEQVKSFGADALLSADCKHNQLLAASHLGITLVDGGHFATENIIVKPLTEKLQNHFAKTKFVPYLDSEIKYCGEKK